MVLRGSVLAALALVACRAESGLAPNEAAKDLLSRIPARPAPVLDEARAAELASLSLACVDREYPNKPGEILDGDETVKPPREIHPAFHGCFDWHSSVHGHWAMVRILRTFPRLGLAPEIRDALDRHLSPKRIRAEASYLEIPRNRTFERPYGLGWLLRLAAELHTWDDPDARRWEASLAPLARIASTRLGEYLDALSAPVRDGTHSSTAFALCHAHDYAAAAGDDDLRSTIERRSRDFFLGDVDCPASYEPSGEDFVSPCLAEADLMRRVLPPGDFVPWLDRFLPHPAGPEFATLLAPPEVRDPTDPRIGHLIGLMLQRASALEGVASALPASDPRRTLFVRISAIHASRGLELMKESGYGGEHWLATFAIFHLTRSGPY